MSKGNYCVGQEYRSLQLYQRAKRRRIVIRLWVDYEDHNSQRRRCWKRYRKTQYKVSCG